MQRYRSFFKTARIVSLLVFTTSLIAQTVRIDTTSPVNTINPRNSVGAGVDRIPVDAIDHDLTKQALPPVLESGWQPVTYRQNTDLAVEAWHWNPKGTWSDPSGRQGYFTGSTTSIGFIRHSFGYALPHRGVTRNDGTGNIGFSGMTDGIDVVVVGMASCAEGFEVLQSADMHVDTRQSPRL